MQSRHADLACCGRCAGPEAAARIARRQRYRAAVFPGPGRGPAGADGIHVSADGIHVSADGIHVSADGIYVSADGIHVSADGIHVSAPTDPVRAVTGALLDISPHIAVVAVAGEEQRFMLTAGAAVWRGGPTGATQLRPGERVVVRLVPGRRDVADKIWASIGRVAGTISGWDDGRLLVDEGVTKGCQAVVISPHARNRVAVRFPQLEPGSLIDVIGLRRGQVLEATVPATSQPAYLASRVARGRAAVTAATGTISGSATWHEPAEPDEETRGVAYPAIGPEAGCAEAATDAPGCVDLPYLAVGSMLLVRNECTGAARLLPVTGCGAVARLFHDRCVTCGTSPRGRVADLTMASFVELGGELERGCFNATISAGW